MVRDFKAGLVTSLNKFYLPSGAGTIVHNLDLSDGSFRARLGYDSVFVFPGMDNFVGLYGAYYSWGEQQLMAAVDSTGVGYGAIYASEMGRHDFGVETYDSLHVTPDTASILSGKCFTLSGSEVPAFCDTLTYTDTIIYRDSTWVLSISVDDADTTVKWWCDTIVNWINGAAGPWLTATNSGDTTVKIVEDSFYLDISFRFAFADVTQWAVSSGPPSKIWPYWSTQNPTSFAMFNDNVYMVNGDQRGVVWNGEIAHSYPLAAFGEPLITPISRQSGEDEDYVIDGEVRYALRHLYKRGGSNVYNIGLLGPVSAPVKTKNGRFLLRNFAMHPVDSLVDSTIIPSGDTLVYLVYRTTSNPGRLDESMRLYSTNIYVKITAEDSCMVQNAAGVDDTNKFTSLADVVLIDSLSDTALANRDGTGVLALDTVWAGRDSTGVLTRRPGAPGFVSGLTPDSVGANDSAWFGDTAYAANDTGWSANIDWGIWCGIPPQKDTLGFAYAIAPIDTLTGNEGPLSEWCVIYNDADNANKFYALTIGLPPLPPDDSGIVYNLYRSMVYQVGQFTPGYDGNYDSAFSAWYNDQSDLFKSQHNKITAKKYFNTWLFGTPWKRDLWNRYVWIDPTYSVDTTILLYPFLVAQIPAADTIYVDSMRYDTLELRRAYTQTDPPARLSRIFSYDGYLFGTDGSLLYRSQVDSATKWGFWDFTPVNNDDGDRITTAYPFRGGIRVKKNFTSWNTFSEYTKTEINDGWGCIAPYSSIKGADRYFLSTRGIEGESEGLYLDRTILSKPLSGQLNDFDDRTISDLSDMVGFYLPTDQTALFSLGDTTWAFFEKTGAWATWSMPFKGATLYDTEDALNFIPGKTMYFYKEDDPNLYRYGTSNSDNGTAIPVTWRSGVFGADRRLDQIIDIGLWVTSTDGNDSTIVARIYDETGSVSDSVVFPSLASEAYILKNYGNRSPLQYFQIELYSSGIQSNTEINMMDFTVNRQAGHFKGE